MTDRLTYLPTAIRDLQRWISDREWNDELVTSNHYERLQRWQTAVKAGQLYEPNF